MWKFNDRDWNSVEHLLDDRYFLVQKGALTSLYYLIVLILKTAED